MGIVSEIIIKFIAWFDNSKMINLPSYNRQVIQLRKDNIKELGFIVLYKCYITIIVSPSSFILLLKLDEPFMAVAEVSYGNPLEAEM